MDTKDNVMTTGIERMNALIAWWGLPAAGANGAMERQMKRFQQFATELQKTYGDAYSSEMSALFSSNERLGRSVQELLQCRQPQEVLAAEAEFMATFLEGASSRARRWTELTEKLQECCAGMARDAAADLRQQAQETTPQKGDGEAQPAKVARRQSA